MQQLHLVGFTTDLEGLIFSARKGSKSGSFVVPIDDGLLATIEDAQRMRDGEPEESPRGRGSGSGGSGSGGSGGGSRSAARPRPESTLSPREIQARLRAGSTIREVANAAGVDEDWVHRFAVPILAEQQQVVQRARQLVYAKARLGDSAQPLGTSVLWNMVDRGQRMTEAGFEGAWRGWNLHGAVWVVQFAYVSRQRGQAAEWEVDLREGTLHARNRLAADLGYIPPGRRRRSQPLFEAPEPEAPAPVRGTKTAASKGVAKQARPSAKAATTTRSAKTAKAVSAKAKATKAGRTAKAAKPAKPAKATKATKGGRKRAAPAPGAGEERVSHLARPMTPPARRGAARDGTPAEPARRPITPAPRALGLRPAPRPAGLASAPPASRIERQKGRPAGPPPVAEEAARRPPASPARPIVPPPPVGSVGDGTVVVRRPPAANGQPAAGPPRRAAEPAPPPRRRENEPSRAEQAAPPRRREAEPPRARADGPRLRDAEPSRPERAPQPAAARRDPTPSPRRPEAPPARAEPGRDRPRQAPTPSDQPRTNGAAPAEVWHGPGSGDPAPPVRIRADMAATASANAAEGRRVRRSAGRDRPLRAR